MKQIERPDWLKMWAQPPQFQNTYNEWFDEHVEPVNKLLSEAVEVFGYDTESSIWQKPDYHDLHQVTHKAYLIGIEPIKEETAEELLIEARGRLASIDPNEHYDITKKITAYLKANRVLGE